MLNICNIHIEEGVSKELPRILSFLCLCVASLLVSCDSDDPDTISTKKRVAPADSTQSSAIIMNCDTTWGNEIHQDF